jgi:hypothetical protein
MAAGLFGLPDPASLEPRPAEFSVQTDPRLLRIRDYFRQLGSPAHAYAEDFIDAADRNNLDWRLLPGISIIESGGGKAARNNNFFGWNNGDHRFGTAREGIYHVASRLRLSPYYRNKSVEQILRVYNPREDYPPKVTWVMERIGPENLVPAGVF